MPAQTNPHIDPQAEALGKVYALLLEAARQARARRQAQEEAENEQPPVPAAAAADGQ